MGCWKGGSWRRNIMYISLIECSLPTRSDNLTWNWQIGFIFFLFSFLWVLCFIDYVESGVSMDEISWLWDVKVIRLSTPRSFAFIWRLEEFDNVLQGNLGLQYILILQRRESMFFQLFSLIKAWEYRVEWPEGFKICWSGTVSVNLWGSFSLCLVDSSKPNWWFWILVGNDIRFVLTFIIIEPLSYFIWGQLCTLYFST